MGLSKEDAIIKHRKMWNWIADESLKRDEKVFKSDYFSEMITPEEIPVYHCYCCQYIKDLCGSVCTRFCISKCPFVWDDNPITIFNMCFHGIYARWVDATDPIICAEVARKIANLPLKED